MLRLVERQLTGREGQQDVADEARLVDEEQRRVSAKTPGGDRRARATGADDEERIGCGQGSPPAALEASGPPFVLAAVLAAALVAALVASVQLTVPGRAAPASGT